MISKTKYIHTLLHVLASGLIITAVLAQPLPARAAWIWTPETGKWLNPKRAVKDTAEQQFKWAIDFYNSKDYKRAISEFNKLVSYYPNSTYAPQAQYYIGRAYDDEAEYYHAYLAYQKVIEAYPHAKNREEIIKREYDIGILFFKGQKAKVLGVAVMPAIDKAVEIFEQVVKNSPYGPYADKSQFKVGESYKRSNRFAEAILAFQKMIDEYPKSELVDKANYQIAQCAYTSSLGYSYDQESTDVAIKRFKAFMDETGDSNLTKDAHEALVRLNDKKAQSLYDTAQFYERIGQKASAAIYYKEVVDNHPNSSLAKDSVTRIMKIDKALSKKSKDRL